MDDLQSRCSHFSRSIAAFCALLLVAVLSGCRTPRESRTVDYHETEYDAVAQAGYVTLGDAWYGDVTLAGEAGELAGPHPVDDYIQYALSQNPKILAARHNLDAKAQRIPQAESLEDPMVGVMGWPFNPYVPQTAAGRVTTELTASQKIPWYGKLRTQAEAASAETSVAQAELAAAELEVIEQVKRAYYELYYLQKTLEITRKSRDLLMNFAEIARTRYAANEVSQQDVLRAELEVTDVDSELIRLRQEMQSGQARLCRLLHVSPETEVRAVDELPREQIPHDLEQLYVRAVAARPELHAQLAALERDRSKIELARLQYYPDVTASVGWGAMTQNRALSTVADGIDMVGIGAMVNVPLYRKRLAAGVCEAESQAASTARNYEALRDGTQEEVKDLFAQASSRQELVKLFRDEVVPRADQTLRVSVEAYQVGRTDFLQLIDNWRQLLKYQIAAHQLESQLRQTLASLERVVGGGLAAEIESSADSLPPQPAESR